MVKILGIVYFRNLRLMKFLVLRFSSIGDIVLTTPVMRCLKIQVPGSEVHYVTKRQYATILENNPYVDKSFFLTDRLSDLIGLLKKENYDLVVDLHRNLRTRLLKWRLGVPARSFNKLNVQKWLMVNLKINRLPAVHIVDRYLETVAPWSVKNDGLGLDYFIPKNDEVLVSSLPEKFQHGYVAFAIGGQHETKKLPVSRLIELCKQLDRPVILLGGPEDRQAGEQVRTALTAERSVEEEFIFNACGLFNLNQSASILRQSQLVISHDTGLMHIAAALKKEIISIWGNTIPAFGMYPYGTTYQAWENKNLRCRPCSKIGFEKCPKGHFKCMNELRFERVS